MTGIVQRYIAVSSEEETAEDDGSETSWSKVLFCVFCMPEKI
jgi:hypothetical protein